MSWSVAIPQFPQDKAEQAAFVNEVLAEDVVEAIEAAQPPFEMAEGPAAQLAEAKAHATALVQSGPLAGKRAYRVSLSGHADPGDQSTAADCITVSIHEIR